MNDPLVRLGIRGALVRRMLFAGLGVAIAGLMVVFVRRRRAVHEVTAYEASDYVAPQPDAMPAAPHAPVHMAVAPSAPEAPVPDDAADADAAAS